jgi:hypothetical protein
MSWYARAVPVSFGILFSAAVPAHHSLVAFDRSRIEEIEGEITRLGWRNPHLTAEVRVTAPDGSVQMWRIEALRA